MGSLVEKDPPMWKIPWAVLFLVMVETFCSVTKLVIGGGAHGVRGAGGALSGGSARGALS